MKSKKNAVPLRGAALDETLDHELEAMLADGYAASPISIASLTKRLGLSSRSTLHTSVRKAKILGALARQKLATGEEVELESRRKSLEEKNAHLGQVNMQLQRQIDHQLELMCRVVANATAKGWDVEYLLSPLRRNGRELV